MVATHMIDADGVADMSTEELMAEAAASSGHVAAEQARLFRFLGEIGAREGWRPEGFTSLEAWIVERLGVSVATARAWAHVAEKLSDLPELSEALRVGELNFDKVRAVIDAATPETDGAVRAQAKDCSVRELAELARSSNGVSEAAARTDYEMRSIRFNDTHRTVTAQLPLEAYSEVRASLEELARQIPSDGETRWDQRLCDGLLGLIRADHGPGAGAGAGGVASHYVVVVHTPLATVVDETSELAGELERGGLVSCETVRRIACDATVAIAVDDDVGHTMYEGRARRFPTAAQRREIMRRDRHCRFSGCTNVTFTNVHHIKPWGSGGSTDLDNMVLLCEYHHHRLHSRGWTMSGNANGELTFIAPTGRVMTSRPSPMWTTVSTS